MADINLKVICIGAATQDVFLTGKALTAKRDVKSHDYVEMFPLGAKLELEGVHFDTGGGGTNAAVTFSRQGFRTEYVGKVGHDPAGAEIIRVLKKEGIMTDRVAFDGKKSSGYSVLLLAPNGERTVLVYRGASQTLDAHDVDAKKLEADWFYVTSLAGNFDLMKKILRQAKSYGVKVAWNPGSGELRKPNKIKALLPDVEILLANREEMQAIFGGQDVKEIMTRAFGVCPYIVLTDGHMGTYASDSSKIYHAGLYQDVKVVDRTGAGDAFNSAFVAGIAQHMTIEDALTLAAANGTAVVSKVGAKAGILHHQRLRRMKIQTISI